MLVHTVCVWGGRLWHHHPTTCWMFWPWPQGQLSEGGLTQIMKCHISLFKKKWFSSFRTAHRGWMEPHVFIMVSMVDSYLVFHGFLSNCKIQVCFQNMVTQTKWKTLLKCNFSLKQKLRDAIYEKDGSKAPWKPVLIVLIEADTGVKLPGFAAGSLCDLGHLFVLQFPQP